MREGTAAPAADQPPSLPADTGAPRAKRPAWRRWAAVAAKVLVAGGLLAYVLANHVDRQAKDELRQIFIGAPQYLLLAVAVFSLQIAITAQRLRVLLAHAGVRLSFLTTLRLNYLGAFFDAFMVTSVGGDAVKAVYLAQEAPRGRRVETISVLVMDRFTGLLGLMAVTIAAALLHFRALSADPAVQPHLKWLAVVPLLLLAGMAGLLSPRLRGWGPLQWTMRKMPLGAILDRAFAALQQFRERPGAVAAAWALSAAGHALTCAAGYFLVVGAGGRPDPLPFVVAWYIANFICSFAPFAGIGVGQAVYNPLFLSIAGLERGWVLATAVQATMLVAKAPGLIAWLVSRVHLEERPAAAPPRAP